MTGVRKEAVIGYVPACWDIKPLAEVSDFITKGGTPTTYGFDWADESNGIPFFRSECVTDEGFNPKGMNFIPAEAHNQMSRSEIKPGDLLMTITGNVGRVAKASERFSTANINQHIARIRVLSDACADADFVYQCLKHQAYAIYYRAILTGQAYPQISLEQVRGTPVAFPPLPEQKKIAAILTAVDDKLDVIARQIEATQTLKQGLMQTLFSRGVGTQDAAGRWVPHAEFKDSEVGEIPSSWECRKLGSVLAQRPEYGANASAVKFDAENRIRYLRITDIDEYGRLRTDSIKAIQKDAAQDYMLKDGDLLIARSGNTVGKSILYRDCMGDCAFAGYLLRFRFNQSALVEFVAAYLASPTYWAWVKASVKVGAQPNINAQQYQSMLIPLPPLKEQEHIAEALASIEAKTELLRNRELHYKRLKRGLMQKLLTGEWRVKLDSSPGTA
ncbi:restriction endonuclease subunit S [Metapseudomonas furukawaii]|uniref:restriction endonuclease subunit S n=1 Tax=Metapseudomonas furukawaii TaxID=1149133 RepID=UPI00227A41E0|nr:restriction endonuclease subunit S [Pseudomonas furukawaii]WAG79101.1 restriction endonuclease subunit S [Pseudomonas furukawaii]